jgi:hypothetical protein
LIDPYFVPLGVLFKKQLLLLLQEHGELLAVDDGIPVRISFVGSGLLRQNVSAENF